MVEYRGLMAALFGFLIGYTELYGSKMALDFSCSNSHVMSGQIHVMNGYLSRNAYFGYFLRYTISKHRTVRHDNRYIS